VTRLIHGEEGLASARRVTSALIQGEEASLSLHEIEQAFEGAPSHTLALGDAALVDVLVASAACASKRQAREDLANGAIAVNGSKVQDPAATLGDKDRLHGRFTVLRRGKKNYTLLRWN